jgi:tRNA threonylcarbamoyladenosine biosynthesis protein TsaE
MTLERQRKVSESEMVDIAKELLSLSVKIYALTGDVGAGKTTLVKAMCNVLGVTEMVSSPTFSLANNYQTDNLSVLHLDLYRLENEQQWFDAGLHELIDDADYVFIEWPERILNLLDWNYVLVSILHHGADSRQINISMITK